MSQELLPCPFCGGEAVIKSNKTVMVSCTFCSASTFQTLRYTESAIRDWNTRPTAQAVAVDDAAVRRLASHLKGKLFYGTLNDEAREERAREMLQAAMGGVAPCWCLTCDPVTVRMALCPDCGNKRCPRARDHRNACTGSNEPGQPGSAYP